MEPLKREHYTRRLEDFAGKDLIKVVTGVRRSGKSTLFRLFIDRLKDKGVGESQILFYNFEDFGLRKALENPMGLHEEIVARAENTETLYVFLDEIQKMPAFENFVSSLHLRPNIDVYITGSNAYLLSGELSTLLTGRYVQIHVLPLSFKEFLGAKQDRRPDAAFNEYMRFGGMPGVAGLPEMLHTQYLRDVFESIIEKDILFRHKWHKDNHFERILNFLLGSTGSPVSANNITNALKANNIAVSRNTVEDYMAALSESYLFYKCSRYDIKGKGVLATGEKYYVADLGFKRAILGSENTDYGHNLENIVYLELLRRSDRLYTGKSNGKEVDFVQIDKDGYKNYYQVAWTAMSGETLERELAPLNAIKDSNAKYLLTMDPPSGDSYNGIRKLNAVDWLMGQDFFRTP
ncbi:MAG: ATP-binding protein [Chitinispirillia bacterium]|nr:ATP-binding protein [Chitinispirillia bacterium]MCL2242509.1 ATP-binding protein [Chitinispirillia bacterium]